MTDSPEPPADETPMQRALRLKKAAMQAKPQPPGRGGQPKPSTAVASGASRPWMKR